MDDYEKTTRREEHTYEQIETAHANIKKDPVFNLSLKKWLQIVLLPLLTVSLLSAGLILTVVYFSMYDFIFKLETKMENNYAFLMTKQNTSATAIHDLVNEGRGTKELLEQRETVAFSAYRSSSQTLSYQGETVIFDGVWTNVGNGYEPSTGIFKAPHPGLYHLTAVVCSNKGRNLDVYIYHNNLWKSRRYLSGDGYKFGTFDVVFNLEKGDTVHISSGQTQTIYYSSQFRTIVFSGYRIT
ncbi:unnamed protein product [Mytilus coruscus]|uniref:C1q domain-containing protein n=1 Tax=Mytilus coruscus TaxID=42192 RepID=A0A6J8CIL2_MYTCO|nr:unnamed protein product [Mytilus coruscus]